MFLIESANIESFAETKPQVPTFDEVDVDLIGE